MSVVNTQTKLLRPRYRDLREWMEDTRNVYIGRKYEVFIDSPNGGKERFPPHSSVFANPYRVTNELSESESMKLYEEHMRLKLCMYPDLVHDLLCLKKKNIGCSNPTHAGVLLKLISEIDGVEILRCNEASHYSLQTQLSRVYTPQIA